jgi:UDP:flavonoid glycosyltransferase YjiC (YdhE family)
VLSTETHAEQIRGAGGEYLPFRFVAQRDLTRRPDSSAEPEIQRVLREVFLNPGGDTPAGRRRVGGLAARVLFTLGSAIFPGELRLPENAVAERSFPHAAVLPHASLVVTHAGHGTVMAAACAGVPLLCTPMGCDQHVVGACVERAKLGRVVAMTASPEQLRAAIGAALEDAGLREGARRFAAGVDLASGLARALDVLEGLRARPR